MSKSLRNISIITAASGILIYILTTTSPVIVKDKDSFIRAVKSKNDITVACDTLDLTNVHSLVVSSKINFGGCVVICDSVFKSDSLFTFILDQGSIRNGKIQGPNGDVSTNQIGYYGAIRIRSYGDVDKMYFDRCDKWAIDIRGNKTTIDTSRITNCIFRNTKRDGYGYSISNHSGSLIVENCDFDHGRHFIDGYGSNGSYIIRNNIFGEICYQHRIHLHSAVDNGGFPRTHKGMFFTNNIIYGKQLVFELYEPFDSIISIFENNYFEPQSPLGKISYTPIEQYSGWKNNYTANDMLQAPIITYPYNTQIGKDTFNLDLMRIENYANFDTVVFYNLPTDLTTPFAISYSAHGFKDNKKSKRSENIELHVVDNKSTKYLTFNLKSKNIKFNILKSDSSFVDSISINKILNWNNFILDGDNYIIEAQGPGEFYLDDVSTRTYFDTFEKPGPLKIKVKYKFSSIKSKVGVGRFIGEQYTGGYCLRVTINDNSKFYFR